MSKRDRQGEEVKNVRGTPKGNERRRFSHVTTPHVRRQIFTCGSRTGKGNPWDARVRPPFVSLSPSLSLSLSYTKVEVHMHIYAWLRKTSPRISSSRKLRRDLADTLERRRVCSIIGRTQGTGKRTGERGNGALKRSCRD